MAPTHTALEIATKLGMLTTRVYYLCRKHGLTLKTDTNFVTAKINTDILAARKKKPIPMGQDELAYNLVMVRKWCMRYASKSPFPQEAQDFASWAGVALLTGQSFETDVSILWIDYLRQRFGRTSTEYGKQKAEAIHTQSPEYKQYAHTEAPSAFAILDTLTFKTPTHRVVTALYYVCGFTLYEIGAVLGVTEGAVSLMLTEAKRSVGRG